MAFKLNVAKFNGSAEWTYEEVGTLASVCKGMSLRFTKTNLASEKRVTILAKDKNDEEHPIPCSASLSKSIRAALKVTGAKKVLASLVKLMVQQSTEDPEKYFLMAPQGEALEGFLVEDLTKEMVTFEDLLALA